MQSDCDSGATPPTAWYLAQWYTGSVEIDAPSVPLPVVQSAKSKTLDHGHRRYRHRVILHLCSEQTPLPLAFSGPKLRVCFVPAKQVNTKPLYQIRHGGTRVEDTEALARAALQGRRGEADPDSFGHHS